MRQNENAGRVLAALWEKYGTGMLEEVTETCPGVYLCRLTGGVTVMARVGRAGRVELCRLEST